MGVISIKIIDLESALRIGQNSLLFRKQKGFLPMAVSVVDIRGEVKVHLADDGTSLYRFKIATGKARGALGLGFGGAELERRARKVPHFIQAVQSLTEGNLVPVRGGVLIRDQSGEVVGALGISGDTSENDELCAVNGIRDSGFTPDTGVEGSDGVEPFILA